MKKALSVLLVAAALFGFYGSAVTVNDLLACKDYWEEAGEKSTADMNKLEDGLNQLKDNEQAYLDGIDQVAEGEKALAEGEATLAKGEADYAAAPAKLAAGRAAIADGEDALASLDELLDGIKQIHDGYNTMSAYEKLRDGRDATLKALQDPTSDTYAASYKLFKTMEGLKDVNPVAASAYQNLGAASMILGDPSVQQAGNYSDEQYDKFDEAMGYQIDGLTNAKAVLDGINNTISAPLPNLPKSAEEAASWTKWSDTADTMDNLDGLTPYVQKLTAGMNMPGTQIPVSTAWNSALSSFNALDPGTYGNAATCGGILALISSNLTDNASQVQENLNTAKEAHDGIATLKASGDAKKKAVGGVAQIINGVYNSGNKTLIKGFERGAEAAGIKLNDFNPSSSSKLAKDMKSSNSIDDFYNDLKAIDKAFQKAKATVNKLKKDGKKQLAAGKKQLAQGLADYKAAPGKLADGRQQLEDGRKQLADGKAQLAQYEDGEQQIRDGLATLFNTESDLELESIANRLNGDGDFDNGDNHLEIDEGLNAVEVGRGYQAEDGVLITNEIMGRAVATGGLIGAAVLAVLAAILSFLKKNKAAGVFAILAAAAGAFGAFYGPAQGTYFSDIAGSTVGATTWVAAGVLGAVALVHAIAHFAAPKNA